MSPQITNLHEEAATALEKLRKLFNRNMLLTFVATDPKDDECSVIVTNAKTDADSIKVLCALAKRLK